MKASEFKVGQDVQMDAVRYRAQTAEQQLAQAQQDAQEEEQP